MKYLDNDEIKNYPLIDFDGRIHLVDDQKKIPTFIEKIEIGLHPILVNTTISDCHSFTSLDGQSLILSFLFAKMSFLFAKMDFFQLINN